MGIPPEKKNEKSIADLLNEGAGSKAALKPIYEKLARAIEQIGKDAKIETQKTHVSLVRNRPFAVIKASAKDHVDLGLRIPKVTATGRLQPAGSFATEQVTHKIVLHSPEDVDKSVIHWLKMAYKNAK